MRGVAFSELRKCHVLVVRFFRSFSLCHLCVLCVSVVDRISRRIHHRDTENTEMAQRKPNPKLKRDKGILPERKSVVMAVVAIDLTSNLATRPRGAVYVYISGACAHGLYQLI